MPFIRLKTASNSDLVINVDHLVSFSRSNAEVETKVTTVNMVDGSSYEVVESPRVIRGLISGKNID